MSYERKLAPDQPAANDPKYVVIELRARIAALEAIIGKQEEELHQGELEFNRMSIAYVHECARLKIRAEQAEAELAALKEMLRLAWGAATDPFNAGRYLLPYEQWLAELQRRWTARAEEGGDHD